MHSDIQVNRYKGDNKVVLLSNYTVIFNATYDLQFKNANRSTSAVLCRTYIKIGRWIEAITERIWIRSTV
jgi:hypothetical protein